MPITFNNWSFRFLNFRFANNTLNLNLFLIFSNISNLINDTGLLVSINSNKFIICLFKELIFTRQEEPASLSFLNGYNGPICYVSCCNQNRLDLNYLLRILLLRVGAVELVMTLLFVVEADHSTPYMSGSFSPQFLQAVSLLFCMFPVIAGFLSISATLFAMHLICSRKSSTVLALRDNAMAQKSYVIFTSRWIQFVVGRSRRSIKASLSMAY